MAISKCVSFLFFIVMPKCAVLRSSTYSNISSLQHHVQHKMILQFSSQTFKVVDGYLIKSKRHLGFSSSSSKLHYFYYRMSNKINRIHFHTITLTKIRSIKWYSIFKSLKCYIT